MPRKPERLDAETALGLIQEDLRVYQSETGGRVVLMNAEDSTGQPVAVIVLPDARVVETKDGLALAPVHSGTPATTLATMEA